MKKGLEFKSVTSILRLTDLKHAASGLGVEGGREALAPGPELTLTVTEGMNIFSAVN